MTTLLLILRIEGALCALFGLWGHNWVLVLAGALCWAVAPLLRREIAT